MIRRDGSHTKMSNLLKEDDNTVNPYDGPRIDGGGCYEERRKVNLPTLRLNVICGNWVNTHDDFEDHGKSENQFFRRW